MVYRGKLLTALALALGTILGQGDACRCFSKPALCDNFEEADVVLHAKALSRSDQEDINDAVTYTVSPITIYKSEPDVSYEQEISFITGGNSALCGIYLELGEEYLIHLSRSDFFDGQLTGDSCGGTKGWSLVTKEESEILENDACSNDDACELSCGKFQECRVYLEGTEYEEEYCADVCDPSPCADDEICELVQVYCIALVGVICSPEAQCTALSTAAP